MRICLLLPYRFSISKGLCALIKNDIILAWLWALIMKKIRNRIIIIRYSWVFDRIGHGSGVQWLKWVVSPVTTTSRDCYYFLATTRHI